MSSLSHPSQFLLIALAGWINEQQQDLIPGAAFGASTSD
jgi:hypothetical protein